MKQVACKQEVHRCIIQYIFHLAQFKHPEVVQATVIHQEPRAERPVRCGEGALVQALKWRPAGCLEKRWRLASEFPAWMFYFSLRLPSG